MHVTGLHLKKCRNVLDNETKEAKEQYFKNALREDEGNYRTWLGATWWIINELITSRKIYSFSVKEVKLNNSSISDPQELSSAF